MAKQKSNVLKWVLIALGIVIILAIVATMLILSYFSFDATPSTTTQIANPASVYCGEIGGTLEIRDTDLGQIGICIKDGKECEEWALFHQECSF
jgi:uncharacterized protein